MFADRGDHCAGDSLTSTRQVPQTDRTNRRRDALLALRAEGLKLRDAEGRTPCLQTKLGAINADKY